MSQVDGAGFLHRYIPAQRDDLPLLLLLHGTGGDENDLLPLGKQILPGAALLAPRGKVLENGMPRYFRRLSEGVFDLDDLRVRARDLAEFVRTSAGTYGFDVGRVIAAGHSNGANIAAALLLLHPSLLAGAVLFHAQTPIQPDAMPNLQNVPVLLTGGRADQMVPAVETQRLAVQLEEAGASVTLHWESGGHALASAEIEVARAWLDQLAAPRRAP